MSSRSEQGVTLLELLISMAIGLLVLGSALQVIVIHSRQLADSEALTLLHDQAQTAMRFLRHDIENAGHWGIASTAQYIQGRSLPGQDNPATLPTPTRCPAKYTLDLATAITVSPDPDSWQCALTASPGSDAVTLRFATAQPRAPQANRLQLLASPGRGALDATGNNANHTVEPTLRYDLRVLGYYVADDSNLFPGQPALRRLTLTAYSSRPVFRDEEISVGVEHFRITAAIDTNEDGQTDRWVTSSDPLLNDRLADQTPRYPAAALRLDIIVKSAKADRSATDPQQFTVAGTQWVAPTDGHQRVHVSNTIAIQNWRKTW